MLSSKADQPFAIRIQRLLANEGVKMEHRGRIGTLEHIVQGEVKAG